MIDALGMLVIALVVVAFNIFVTRYLLGSRYEEASKKEKIMMEIINFGVMLGLLLLYIVLISNL